MRGPPPQQPALHLIRQAAPQEQPEQPIGRLCPACGLEPIRWANALQCEDCLVGITPESRQVAERHRRDEQRRAAKTLATKAKRAKV